MARRLAAILAADVVGYSRLMAVDEAGTHARLKALRQDFIEPKIAEHHGRVAKLMGDGALVEFASVVDAVECAAAIQSGVAERQAELPEDQRIAFRIGINIGDVIIEEGDIYGDGVNVAARLEALAEPGEICVSRTVYNHAKAKVAFGFEPMGEHRVKNIPEPVTVYRVITEPGPIAKALGLKRAGTPAWRLGALAAAAVVLLVAAGGAGLWLRSDDGAPPAPQQAATPVTTSEARGGAQQAPLDKYRIAVLPFANISADPEDEYFSDGMTEELISKLSRLHDLTVIARTSIMQYKETGKSIAEIGRELRVGTILEGSVRKAGDRLRITAQLVDVASQGHLWSEDYDRTLDDVFAIQSDVAQHVAQALQITLKPAETTAAREGRNGRPGGVQRLSPGPLPLQHVVEGGSGEKHRVLRAGDRAGSGLCQSLRRHGFLLRYAGRIWLSRRRTRLSKGEAGCAPRPRARCHDRRGLHRVGDGCDLLRLRLDSRRRRLSPCPRTQPQFRGHP